MLTGFFMPTVVNKLADFEDYSQYSDSNQQLKNHELYKNLRC